MDYEKALERARAAYGTGAYDDATLEFIFPQIKESEDERIRKELLAVINDLVLPDEQNARFNAYLEKQKEHQNNSDAPNESSWSGMISSSDKDKNLDEIAQDYVDGVKEYNPEPTWDLMQTAVCYGYHLAEQKEQKPAELEQLAKLREMTHEIREAYERGIEVGRAESKQAWSEEEKEIIEKVVSLIKQVQDDEDWHLGKWSDDAIDLLESLIHQPEQEWSGVDDLRLHQTIDVCDRNGYPVLSKWLKGLPRRVTPQSSWKPSEEQMKALKIARSFVVDDFSESPTLSEILKALQEQLEKLM